MPLALHGGFGGRAPAETHVAQGAAAAWVTHRRSLRVLCVSCHLPPCPSLRGTGTSQRTPPAPSAALRMAAVAIPVGASPRHSPAPGFAPCSSESCARAPQHHPCPHGLPDPTRWLGDGLRTTVTGSPGSSQSLRRSREMYGKNLHKQGSKV